MAISESRKKANKKWDAANLDRISLAMAKGKREIIKAAAAESGESMNQYIIGAIDSRISGNQAPQGTSGERDILTPEALKTAQEAAQRAGETVSSFIGRAVEVQAQRDKVIQSMRQKEKAPGKPEA